jgi:Uma2 family endonuclease
LGILINRKSHQVEIYRQGKEVEVLDSPTTVSGEDVLNPHSAAQSRKKDSSFVLLFSPQVDY